MVKALLNWLFKRDKQEVTDFCNTIVEPNIVTTGNILEGWNLQDTPYGCNGDLVANENTVLAISHTNPKYTQPTNETWKENRVEWAKRIEHNSDVKWHFECNFHKLSTTSEWVIISQLWNREFHNVLSLVVQKSTRQLGKVKLRLDKKVDNKTTTLWSGYFDQYRLHEFKLDVTKYGVVGYINGDYVGEHDVKVYSDKHHQEIKFGMYWSGKIPFNQDNRMVLELKL